MRTVLRLLTATALAASAALAAPATGFADPSSCTVTPGPGSASNAGTATCPANAGDFWFRVVIDCYDAYPSGLHFIGVNYGPWKWAGGDTSTTSSVPCNGYVPGSGVAFNGRLEVR
ncbi:hypothetical protein FXN61_14340 [Lentzea sp. PSKA42]|uniref:Beta/Gamma crystallin n=1 Tax=Lentzea indica TaxID=2604800 RepID=A0ABX1FG52_9PSEU|nr:hypothetical protein [Lentzea indica]NKE57948.1 hypothetical protein [Lentzea indica]